METVLRNTPRTLTHTFAVDGSGTNPSPDSATVAITKADGTTLVADTSATEAGTGAFSYILPTQALLNLLTATWTAAFGAYTVIETDQVEIVGGVYVPLSELRAMPGLEDTDDFSNDKLAHTRRQFEELAEEYTGVAWVPRFAREKVAGQGGTSLLLPHIRPRSVLSASSTDTSGTVTTFTVTNWQVLDHGLLVTDGDSLTASSYGERNLIFEYEHGHDSPPESLRDACRMWVQSKLLRDRSQVSRRVISETDPAGFTQRFSTVDWKAGRPTGIEDVDQILNSLGRAAPMVG